LPSPEEIIGKIEAWKKTAGERPVEVAFFGGSFTALSPDSQAALLNPLHALLRWGDVTSIRLSTRPECIDDSHVAWLAEMGVRTIELGVQSMDDGVLTASGRGHTAADSEAAIRSIKRHGLQVGAQLMPGLPGDSPVSSHASLERVIAAGVDFIRIYPTVVLRRTELARQFAAGDFVPLNLEDGVLLSKKLLHRAMQAGVPVIRIGLQADEGLNEETVLAGCWHPALGQMVRSQLYGDLLCQMISRFPGSMSAKVTCHTRRRSDVVGPAKANLLRLQRMGIKVDVATDDGLLEEEIQFKIDQYHLFKANIITDLKYSIHEV
jgi:histone acetyltransferase (RNA polymerase elongator complex component)